MDYVMRRMLWWMACLILTPGAPGLLADDALSDNDILMRAIVDEMTRSMDALHLEGLPKPYLISISAEDGINYHLRASYGAVLDATRQRTRPIRSRVRVGDYTLDNTNLGFGGGRALLPLDDDYMAFRQTIWRMVDQDYKEAVEILTRKQAYLRQKNVVDRPADYASGAAEVAIEPSPELVFDEAAWRENIRRISLRFKEHPAIQDSGVTFSAAAMNRWMVNSEGTRIRVADTGAFLAIEARLQAEEGMRLADTRSYIAMQPADLPPVQSLLADVDRMCGRLEQASLAPVLEEYTGPVLFSARAAARVFEALLIEGLCARPVPLGGGRGDHSLEKKIGRRILPRTFRVVDDPTMEAFQGTVLAGAYRYDDEGTRTRKVELVEHGILKTLVAARTPTQKITETNGHGRSRRFGDPEANIGCLYISDDNGLGEDELKAALIQATRDEGLPFGLRVEAMQAGRGGALGNPLYFYKVYVADGREEMVRGMEFGPVETRELKRIVAGGRDQSVYNSGVGIGFSIICPALLFEELELSKIDKEFDRLPLLDAPERRPP